MIKYCDHFHSPLRNLGFNDHQIVNSYLTLKSNYNRFYIFFLFIYYYVLEKWNKICYIEYLLETKHMWCDQTNLVKSGKHWLENIIQSKFTVISFGFYCFKSGMIVYHGLPTMQCFQWDICLQVDMWVVSEKTYTATSDNKGVFHH